MSNEMRYTKALTIKAESVGEDGTFSGYASTFGNVDLAGDIIVKGAFTKWLGEMRASGNMPPVLWQHDMGQPIGKTLEIYEDDNGLFVRGKLSDTQLGRDARTLAKDGVLQGMSIGFYIKDGMRDQETGVYLIKEIKVFEYSFVTLPANPLAKIGEIKSLDALNTVRDCETYLRDVCKLSKAEAKRFISVVKNGRDDQDDDSEMKALAAQLNDIAQRMGVTQ